jgi:predicted ArsR family transcriptional regulator
MRPLAAELDISYEAFIQHRDRLAERGLIQFIRKVSCGRGIYRITCPEGAEDELGVDRDPEQTPRRILRWS